MSRLRNLFATVGLATAAVGLLFIADPTLARRVAVPTNAVTLLGGLAVLEGVRSGYRRRRAEFDQADPPDIEERLDRPAPGDGFDERVVGLAERRQARWVGGDYDRVRRRLREAAVAGLRAQGLSQADAEARIASGEWTDDEVAAAFLSDEVAVSLPTELRLLFGRRNRFVTHATRAADAVAALWEVSEE